MTDMIRTMNESPELIDQLDTWKIAIVQDDSHSRFSDSSSEDWSWNKLKQKLGMTCDSPGVTISETETAQPACTAGQAIASTHWSPARYGRTKNGQQELLGVSCAVYDFVGMSPEQLDEILALDTGLGWQGWFLYSLPCHTAHKSSFRIVMPFSELLEPADANAACRLLAMELAEFSSDVFDLVAPESFDIFRKLSWPTESNTFDFWSVDNYGSVVYVDMLLDQYPEWKDDESLSFTEPEYAE